jgi:DNA-binding FadR family transcriptional regulator
MEEHAAIVHAYKEGDQDLLTEAVKYHVTMFRENILESNDFNEAESRGRVVPAGITMSPPI